VDVTLALAFAIGLVLGCGWGLAVGLRAGFSAARSDGSTAMILEGITASLGALTAICDEMGIDAKAPSRRLGEVLVFPGGGGEE